MAGLSLALAAMLSAYGFHGLPGKVPAADLDSWHWANQFHFLHSLGLIALGFWLRIDPASWLLRAAAAAMVAGLVLFCGSIYAETLGASEALGEVAPLGGSAFMLGWFLAGIGAYRLRR
jgi:uncharacterized membrane protein YgdD (TMEM256/DUF423 family)